MSTNPDALYTRLRRVLEDAELFISDDVDERLLGLVEVVLADPRNAKVRVTLPDGCRFCRGAQGGVPGNENLLGPHKIVTCDYCSVLVDEASGKEISSHGVPAHEADRYYTITDTDGQELIVDGKTGETFGSAGAVEPEDTHNPDRVNRSKWPPSSEGGC